MKAAPFDYVRAHSVKQACALLAADAGVRPIAGGQTLVPMLAMRLARPRMLVDLAAIAELSVVRQSPSQVEIGAMARQAQVEHLDVVARHVPLLALALPHVGHAPTRARGTIGGSIANADPAAEIPLVAVTLGAEIVVATTQGESTIAAEDFFIAAMVTSLPLGALVKSIRFPIAAARTGVGFFEVNARDSDFAMASAACQIELNEESLINKVHLGIGGAADVPMKLDLASLTGAPPDAEAIVSLAVEALAQVETVGDMHASAAYRRRAAGALAKRAVTDALRRVAVHP